VQKVRRLLSRYTKAAQVTITQFNKAKRSKRLYRAFKPDEH
jgi:hypothetical protein